MCDCVATGSDLTTLEHAGIVSAFAVAISIFWGVYNPKSFLKFLGWASFAVGALVIAFSPIFGSYLIQNGPEWLVVRDVVSGEITSEPIVVTIAIIDIPLFVFCFFKIAFFYEEKKR